MKTICSILALAALLGGQILAAEASRAATEDGPARQKKVPLPQEGLEALVPLLLHVLRDLADNFDKVTDEASAREHAPALRAAMMRVSFVQGALYRFDISPSMQADLPEELTREMQQVNQRLEAAFERVEAAGYYGSDIIRSMFWK